MFGDAYRGRRVLVTGHTGFKGSWLALWLHRMGAEVYGLSLPPPTSPALFELAGVEARLAAHRIVDIRDREAVARVVQEVGPEALFHLAAQPLVRESYATPVETFATNVMGTAHVLEAIRAIAAVRAVVVVTSDKCYDNRETGEPFVETQALGGHDPYSASKAAAEIAAAAWRRSFFVTTDRPLMATARAGNVIGGGDFARDRILPDAVRAARDGTALVVRRPRAVRPWQHVLEPLGGYLALGARLLRGEVAFAEAWNFGPREREPVTVAEIVDAFHRDLGCGSWTDASEPGPHEAALLSLDCQKAERRLGWRGLWSVHEAVRRTAAWSREVLFEGRSAADACVRDIADYEALAERAGQEWAR